VVVLQTPPLEREIEVTGRLVVKLWASSNADSIVRARYRESLKTGKMLEADRPVEFTIEMYPTSLVFRPGHRIRLDISSSNFPRFDVNPNTGEPLNQNRRWRVADNAVYHDAHHPSRIILPIAPARSTGPTFQQ
jgi:putative CocE/NonD family hydrolase